MESTGSCNRSTAPAADTSLQPPSPSPEFEFKCKYCERTFATARRLGGHQKAHSRLLQELDVRHIQNQKEHRRLSPAGRQVRFPSSLSRVPGLGTESYFDFHTQLFNLYRARMPNFPSSARAGVVPLFAGNGTGGLGPTPPFSTVTGGRGHVASRVHVGTSRQVSQENTTQFYPPLFVTAVPSFLSQTQAGSSTAPAPVADVDCRTGDGVPFGRQQRMQEVNQEEAHDGIDLTLRL